MLLGKDEVISDVAPAYVTDAIFRKVDLNRYDDREIIKTNLIESYELLMEFGRKHLPDRFYLEDDQRKSLRNIITREMIANTLIHREYTSFYQAKFVIEKERMYVENANRASKEEFITPDNIEPNPKNPIIAAFFRNIGYADQLGSGVRNLFRYSKFYSGKEPKFMEGDVFKIIVPIDESLSTDTITQSTTRSTQSTTRSTQSTTNFYQSVTSDDEKSILQLISNTPNISQQDISTQLGINYNTIKYYIRKMQKNKILRREGTNRKGKWVIMQTRQE